MAQIAHQLSNLSKPGGQLPSNIEKNPSGHVNAVTLRSGTTYNPPPMVVVENEEEEVVIEEEAPNEGEMEEQPEPAPEKRKEEINVIKEMPSYAKFLKEVLSNKRKLLEIGVETLRGECNAILECKVSKKEADPGCFTIPVNFGEDLVNKTLADLGATVSIMPTVFMQKHQCGFKPTRMSLQLADRSVRFPVGVVEDFPVQIGKFYVPCDFVIMDIVEDHVIPIILGRDYLKTARAVFDVFNGKLTLNILGEDVEFHLPSRMKGPADESLCRAESGKG
ncbi:uncharacterized protein LOC130805658 [Amaranthus tricolor]|uniref:uncharacterized protein LOC130805658 n=1 Tax=Amaranthus tricolor TaxID=29722 RepID=UPI00258D3EF5|nr:uncharacterized protein LOC130805658 [Amaranthus tricolor]